MVAEAEMECDMAELEELFRTRDDEQPEARAQRIKSGFRSKSVAGVANKFRKEK